MKKTIILAAAIVFSAFTSLIDFSSASAEKKDGVYVFVLSKPTSEYEKLGDVKLGAFQVQWTGEQNINAVIKKAKEKYYDCNGVILDLKMTSAEVIKFKNQQ